MSKPTLDKDGLIYLWNKMKSKFVGVETGKGLSTNDFTNEYKTKVDNAVQSVEGKGLSTNDFTTADKTKLDNLKTSTSWNDITGKPDLANIYQYKGSVSTFGDLPNSLSEGLKQGDVYNVETDDMNYAWTGEKWDPLGSTFSVTPITNAEIDAIVGS